MAEIEARVLEIDTALSMLPPGDPTIPDLEAERAELVAESAALDGSWVTERWLDIVPGPITEAEAIAEYEAAAVQLAQRKLDYAAQRAQLAAWAATPPVGLAALRAAFAVLAARVRERMFDPDLE
jgi:hypothetical protein